MDKNLISIVNGIEIVSVERDGEVFVPIKPICEIVKVNYTTQYEKLTTDPTFSDSVVPLQGITGADGKQYEMVCLPLWLVYLWLGSINPKKVDPEIRKDVISYRRECARVLYEYFQRKGRLATEQAETEARLLRERVDWEERVKASKAEIRRIDGLLATLQEERLNTQPSLF